ncbi:carbonic anhydrase [Acrasis kona]|uniref:Carbonic anhydrase n=1 Tax=Acrasis kona TaxID=1008807 RepID=A0AAW2Z6C2_9EUKA
MNQQEGESNIFEGVEVVEEIESASERIVTATKSISCTNIQEIEQNFSDYDNLFAGNRHFVDRKLREDPEYFSRLVNTQTPKYVLIGCSDSRVPPDRLTNTKPGEMFIHRNVANLVVNTDSNVMSVLQYAVEVLKVKHVIVMGHYGCGGVRASTEKKHHGLIDEWLRNIKDVQRLHWNELQGIDDEDKRLRRLVELNVKEQALNVCKTNILQNAWARGENVHVHGWVYELSTGLIKDLQIEEKEWLNIKPIYDLNSKN